ncbi:MAG: response regulator transcription factor [Acidobacteria bacterium]|nr:response regulator transcription factor [Acidobacteriota bacterium]
MKTVALIDDDPDLQELLRYNLEKVGYRLVGHSTGQDAIIFLQHAQPDLLVLDIMLPHTDGLDICRSIRRHPQLSSLPVIFLTARGAELDRVLGFELGANDYVVKPFFVRELVARIQSLLRRDDLTAEILAVDELALDRGRLEVSRSGEKVALTATEFRLLEFLMTRPGLVWDREQLLDQVWGRDRGVTERAVDVCVLRLRQKLESQPTKPKWIHTVRGFGYTFDPARTAH